jgi:hypothetical protein
MNQPPDKLYLQWHGDSDPDDSAPVCETEVTWCRDRCFGSDVEYVRIEPFLDALESILPQHTAACVSQPDPQTTPWTFDTDVEGNLLITPESCRCAGNVRQARMLLHAHRPSRKGFSPHHPSPPTP